MSGRDVMSGETSPVCDIVDVTLKEWRRTAFAYGQTDCMLSIGRYVAACGGKDITHNFIGLYSDQSGALAQMAMHGGVAGLMDRMDVVRVDGPPERGDIISLIYGDNDNVGALCTGDMVAVRLERGVIEVALKMVRWNGVWRVPS